MNRRRFRWWHGMILGVLLGVVAWQALSMFDATRPPAIADGMPAQRFAQLVATNGGPSNARLTDVRVHPPVEGKHLVTARLSAGGGQPATAIAVFAPIPFVYQPPRQRSTSPADAIARAFGRAAPIAVSPLPPAQTFADVRAFFAKIAPAQPVRYAWWEEPSLRTATAFGVPFLLLGVLLPFALQTLVWLGLLAPMPPAEPKPAKVAPEPTPPTPKVDVDVLVFANGQLDALTDQMAQNLAARSGDEAPSAAPMTATFEPVAAPSHAAPPLEPVTLVTPVDPTTFDAGVYYPVHRPKRGDA